MFCLFFLITLSLAASNYECGNAFCSTCDSNKKCTQCISNYVLNTNNDCVYKRDVGCEEVSTGSDNSYYCTKCSHGYKLDFATHRCVEGDELCADENILHTQKKCSHCKNGYTLGKTTCVDCKEKNIYCLELDDSDDCSKCKKCRQGTELNSKTGNCDLKNEFCKEFAENGKHQYKCQVCRKGYYPDSNGICHQGKIKMCEDYIDETHCSKCLNGNYVVDGECKGECTVENCAFCNAAEPSKCNTCDDGYYLTMKGECSICRDDYCSSCGTYVDMGCQVCDDEYYRTADNSCLLCEETCEDCTPTGCLVCKEGYYKDSNGICTQCDEGCGKCTTAGCTFCKEGYYKNRDGQCKKITVENCQTVTFDGECYDCIEGFYLTSDKKQCKPCSLTDCGYCDSTTCHACKTGYLLSEEGKCEQCSSDCKYCYHNTTYCTMCADEKKSASNGKCFPIIEYCKIYDDSGKCAQCYNSYELDSSKTKCKPEDCSSHYPQDDKYCLQCAADFYMNKDYTCSECDSSCENLGCTSKSTECNKLVSIPLCLIYNKDHTCKECNSPHILENNTCVMDSGHESCLTTFTGRCYLCVWSEIEDGVESITYSFPNEDGECIKGEQDGEGGLAAGWIVLIVICVIIVAVAIAAVIVVLVLKYNRTRGYQQV